MQPYPRAPDLVWPGHLHGTGCLSARAVGTGFPTVVWCLCLGPVGGWVRVLLTPSVLAGVLGGCFGHDLWCCPSSVGCLWCSWLGFGFGLLLGRVWFRGRPACPPPFPVPARGVGVCAGPGSRLCPVRLGWVVGVCFFFFFALWFFLFFFFFFRALWSLSLHPLSFGLGLWLSFFFFFFFFPCPFSPWSAVTGLVLPVLGGWSCCASAGVPFFFFFFFFPRGGGLAACGGVGGWLGGCGLFSCLFPFPPPFFFFFLGGGGLACSSLCLSWAGARTGLHSVLSSGLLSSVAFCVAMFRPHGSGGPCTRWARRPFLLG